MTRWLLVLAVVTGGVVWVDAEGGLTAIGQFTNREIDESSGLARSTTHPGVFWTVNDSGNPPVLYAFELSGKSVGQVTLQGAHNDDWEALAYEPGTLYIGDIGDNGSRRKEVKLWSVAEPDPERTQEVAGRCLRVRYPDGPHNAEAMFAWDGWLYVAIKQFGTAPIGVYRANTSWSTSRRHTFQNVLRLTPGEMITGGDISADGTRIALTGYRHVFVYIGQGKPESILSTRPHKLALGRAGQVEALAFDGLDLVLTNEQGRIFSIRHATYEAAPLAETAGREQP